MVRRRPTWREADRFACAEGRGTNFRRLMSTAGRGGPVPCLAPLWAGTGVVTEWTTARAA